DSLTMLGEHGEVHTFAIPAGAARKRATGPHVRDRLHQRRSGLDSNGSSASRVRAVRPSGAAKPVRLRPLQDRLFRALMRCPFLFGFSRPSFDELSGPLLPAETESQREAERNG